MAVMTRAQQLKQLVPGLNALFGLEYKRYPEFHKDLYETMPSKRAFEEDLKLSGFAIAPVKPEGMETAEDSMQEAWTVRYTHEVVSLGFSVTEEAKEDNLYADVAARGVRALARSMAETKQIKAAAVFNGGFTTFRSGDGAFTFSESHPLVNGEVNANRPATAADLSEESLEAAIVGFASWKDERGLLINARPVSLHIPPALEFVAERILKSEYRPGTADNDTNALMSTRRIPGGAHINNYFTDPAAWFLKTDVAEGFKHFVRIPLRNGVPNNDFKTGNMQYKARERYCFGVTEPLKYYGMPGA